MTESSVDPVADTPVVPQPAPTPEENFSNPSFEDQPKRSKKGKIIAIIAAAAVVLLAAAVVLNLSSLKGFFVKSFGSDEAYFQFVEGNTFSDFADIGSSLYGGLISTYEPVDGSSEVKLDLQFSDELLTLAQNMDLSWLENISMVVSTNIDGQKQDGAIKFLLGNATLLDLNVLFNVEENEMFLGFPNLSDKYISLRDTFNDAMASVPSIEISPEMIEALPSESEINDLLNKYFDIIFDDFGTVSKDTEEIEVGDCSQNVTVLEYELSAKDIMKMAKAMLKELRTDEDVKGYIKDFENFLADEYKDLLEGSGYEKGAIYDAFREIVNEALDEIDTDGVPNLTIFTLTDYVNASHEIVGREIEFGGIKILSYLTVSDGNDFAFEASCAPIDLSITGEGTKKGNTVSAEYDITVGETTLLEVEFIDFDAAAMKGDIKIRPSSDLLGRVLGTGDTENSLISMFAPTLKISLGDESVCFSLLSKNDALVSLTMSAKTGSGESVEMPDESKVVDLENIDDWATSLDLNKLVDALEEAGLPSDLLTMLESVVENIDLGSILTGMGDGFASDGLFGDAYGDMYDDEYFDDEYFDDFYGDEYEDLFDDEWFFS